MFTVNIKGSFVLLFFREQGEDELCNLKLLSDFQKWVDICLTNDNNF